MGESLIIRHILLILRNTVLHCDILQQVYKMGQIMTLLSLVVVEEEDALQSGVMGHKLIKEVDYLEGIALYGITNQLLYIPQPTITVNLSQLTPGDVLE